MIVHTYIESIVYLSEYGFIILCERTRVLDLTTFEPDKIECENQMFRIARIEFIEVHTYLVSGFVMRYKNSCNILDINLSES